MDARTVAQAIVDEVWNNDDHWRVRRLVADGCVFDEWPAASRPAALRLLDLVNAYKAFIPDLTLTVSRQTTAGSCVETHWEASGRHVGLAGGLTPTHRLISLRGTMVTDPRRGGRLVAGTWDRRALLLQLGARGSPLDRLCVPRPDDLAWRSRYESNDIPLLLFPTMSLPGWLTWRRVMEAFRAQRPVITFQLSASRKAFERLPPTAYRLVGENRRLVKTLVRHRNPGPYDIVGHSVGGLLAVDFALTYPDLTRTLTLIEPGLPWLLRATGSLTGAAARELSWRRSLYRPISPARYARFLQDTYREVGYDPRLSPRWPLMCAYRGNMVFRSSILRHEDTTVRLRRLRCPVLLVQGRNSDPFHHAVMGQLRTFLPLAAFVEMPGGHVPHYGAGVAPFVSHLNRFLAGRDTSVAHTA